MSSRATAARERLRARVLAVFGSGARARAILVLASVLGLSSADQATVGASADPLRRSLHLTNTDVGLALTVSGIVAALATLPAGIAVDRINRTRLLSATTAFWAVAMTLSACATSFPMLLATRAVLGAATAVAGPAVASLIGDWFPTAERGRIYGWVLAGEIIGTGIGFIASVDLAAVSWRLAFVALALPALALALVLRRSREPARGGAEQLPVTTGATSDASRAAASAVPDRPRRTASSPASTWTAFRYVLSIRTNLLLILASGLGYFFFAGVRAFGVEFVKGQYGVSQVSVSGLSVVIGAATLAGVLASGRASDTIALRRSRAARVTVAALASTAAVLLFLPALLVTSLAVGLPALCCAGFALAATNPPLDAARLDIMKPALWGRAEAVRSIVRLPAEAVAPVVFGLLADHAFAGGHDGLRSTFLVMLSPLFVSSLVLFAAHRRFTADVQRVAEADPAPVH